MCNPVAMVGLFVAQAAFSYMGERKQAKNDESAVLQERNMALEDNAEVAYEIDDSAAAERSQLAIETLKKRGAMRVASGENMGMGLTTQLLMQDIEAQYGRETTAIDRDRSKRQRQNARQRESIVQGSQNQWNSIKRPSLVGTGLQLAGNIAGSETASSAFKSKPKSTASSTKPKKIVGTQSTWSR